MSTDVRDVIKEHRAFYEVLPYYLVVQENPGKLPAKTRTIRAGFDVDIYGVNTNQELGLPGPDYALGCSELQKVAQQISDHFSHSCSIELVSFPSRIVVGGSGHSEMEAMVRLRIAHQGDVDQPAGSSEEEALKEVEHHLQQLGLARR